MASNGASKSKANDFDFDETINGVRNTLYAFCPLQGVPTFLMHEIRISAISASSLGSHVLLISTDALVFSYGSNGHGQLGPGISESCVSTPTLVTAILESGGKTVHLCGRSGVDCSLICVKTRQRRIQKESADALSENSEGYHLHQLYGFGSNKGCETRKPIRSRRK